MSYLVSWVCLSLNIQLNRRILLAYTLFYPQGILGFITSATLRLYPQPPGIAAAVCSFPSVADGVQTATEIMQFGIPVARIGQPATWAENKIPDDLH